MISWRRPGLLVLLLAISVGSVGLTGVSRGEEMAVAEQGRAINKTGAILTQRQRPAPVNEVLKERLEELLPRLMRETGIDMWLVLNREYAEDPVYFSLVPDPVFAARRTTMLVFFDRGEEEGVERLTVSRYPLGDLYEAAWEGGDLEEQWLRLAEVIREVSESAPAGLDWILRVDGHTDKIPVSRGGRYRDNWQLSQARALSVVRYLIDQEEIPPSRLAATGFGEFQPIYQGDDREEMAVNRRIEFKFTQR